LLDPLAILFLAVLALAVRVIAANAEQLGRWLGLRHSHFGLR
jgi:hypothetical protein